MQGQALERDQEVRLRAFEWLSARVDSDKPWIEWAEILKYKHHDPGGRALANRPQGIWKPRDLVAALSVKTRPPETRTDRTFNYNDALSREGLVAYKMQATQESHNDWVRSAHRLNLPMIYFLGQRGSTYVPIFPVYVTTVDEVRREFLIDVSRANGTAAADIFYADAPIAYETAYAERLVRQRLHQPAFRSAVMLAYRETCAMCSLRRVQLLDAAHIQPDSHGGAARVSNGLSLCKLHHAAFDSNLIGISPDYCIRVRPDVLQERDGPLLTYGIQGLHGRRLRELPRRRADLPDRELLAERFRAFSALTA